VVVVVVYLVTWDDRLVCNALSHTSGLLNKVSCSPWFPASSYDFNGSANPSKSTTLPLLLLSLVVVVVPELSSAQAVKMV